MDCEDGADEPTDPNLCPPCDIGDVRCVSTGRCIISYHVCDGIIHCEDGSDEPGHPDLCPPCRKNQFRCDSGWCINRHHVCNGLIFCPDGSDEKDCPPKGLVINYSICFTTMNLYGIFLKLLQILHVL